MVFAGIRGFREAKNAVSPEEAQQALKSASAEVARIHESVRDPKATLPQLELDDALNVQAEIGIDPNTRKFIAGEGDLELFKETLSGPPVAGIPRDRFVPHPSAGEASRTFDVDVAKLNDDFAADPSNRFIPEGGGGAEIGGRRKRFEEFIETGAEIQQPLLDVQPDGRLDFSDGRHRFSVLRDKGARSIPVTVRFSSKEAAEKETAAILQRLGTEGGGRAGLADQLRTNPRDLTPLQRASLALDRSDINFSAYSGPEGAIAVARTYENLFRDAVGRMDPKTFQETFNESSVAVKDLLGLTAREEQTWLTRVTGEVRGDANAIEAITARVVAYRRLGQDIFEDVSQKLAKVEDFAQLGDDELLALVETIEQSGDYLTAIREVTGAQGRALNSNKIRVGALGDDVGQTLDDVTRQKSSGGTLADRGGREAIVKKLGQTKAIYDAQGINGMGRATKVWKRGAFWDFTTEYFINSVLWGPKTHVVNFVGNTMTALYRPLETVAGGTLQGLAGNKAGFAAAASGLRQIGDIVSTFAELATFGQANWGKGSREIWSAMGRAAKSGDSQLVRGASKIEGAVPSGISAHNANSILLGVPEALAERLPKPVGAGTKFAVDGLGSLFRTPGKLLQAGDELFKQVTARSQIRLRAHQQALEKGVPREEIAAFVANKLDQTIVDGQLFSRDLAYREASQAAQQALTPAVYQNPIHRQDYIQGYLKEHSDSITERLRLSEDAASRAKEVTFTTEADKSLGGRAITAAQSLTTAMPALRFFLPFISTPVNIIRFASQRAGLDVMVGAFDAASRKLSRLPSDQLQETTSRLLKDLSSGDSIRKADAVGRLAMGAGITTTFGVLASNVYNPDATVWVTGRGPSDPNERREWASAGHQAYAIAMRQEDGTIEYVSYARMDPFATIIGTIADSVTYSHFADKEADSDVEALSAAVWTAVANNFTNKTYMQGMNDLVTVLQGGEQNIPKVRRILQKFAGTAIPNFSAQATAVTDPVFREVRTFSDALSARTPWTSQKLDPRRNVLGEPLKRMPSWGADSFGRWTNLYSPVNVSTVKNDPLLRELVDTGHNWSLPGRSMAFDGVPVDLTDFRTEGGNTALDRYQHLTATLRLPGGGSNEPITLRQMLKRVVKSDEYAALKETLPAYGQSDTLKDPRVPILGGIISSFRAQAKRQLLAEMPEIQEFVETHRKTKADAITLFRDALREN